MKGSITWYSEEKGIGFIKPDGEEKDIYFSRSNLSTPDHTIQEGQRVEFEKIKGPKGIEAINIFLADLI